MNRLIDRSKEIPLPCADNALFWARVHEKLAAYEDTEMEPEEMRELLHDSTGPLHKKLGEWIDAEQEDRLVVLPCKVGDVVFSAFENEDVFCGKVYAISTCDGTNWFSVRYDGGLRFDHTWDDFGKTVFLTREDAEKALERMKNDKR